ncbi:putative glutaredoxin-c4 precursor protein [Zalerion maritima]|uniref:Glutaredoxin-c4 protein n=1 Tax=Zalerion maritima TaxID=339359 RepID=A0AAD5RYH0_9PEZI|nr:putative glutaredoxin-c4 precursor protein [Zalerion maritima]
MPSQRRMRLMTIAAFIFVALLFYYGRHDDSDFYSRTVNGLDRKQGDTTGHTGPDPAKIGGMGNPRIDHDDDGHVGEDDEQTALKMAERLREAEQRAKDLANSKSPNRPDNPEKLVGVGNAAGTGDYEPAQKQDVLVDADDPINVKKVEDDEEEDTKAENIPTKEDHEIEDELDSILRRAPVIIFSKSYCPHSRKAKTILLEKYDIDPLPHVVELDKHPLGPGIQARLQEMTGRGTVPNVMVNGKSIGGGSEMEELHQGNDLVTEIEKWGSVGGGKSSKVTVKHHSSG